MHVIARSSSDVDVAVIGAGQAGLAAAQYLKSFGMSFVVLEAGQRASGSWSKYYDSLVLFSPARFSELPGLSFGGNRDRYPVRDEVVEYLERYANHFKFPIRYATHVDDVIKTADGRYRVVAKDGTEVVARSVIAATGSFSTPNVPRIDGAEKFRGTRMHALGYRSVRGWEGKNIVVVGAGNTAVQIAHELSNVSTVRLATRGPIRYVPQRIFGKDVHFWFHWLGLNKTHLFSDQGTPVIEDGRYRRAIDAGRPRHVEMFTAYDEDGVVWKDGRREKIDAVIYGTGYRSAAPYLASLGALDERGLIVHAKGLSPHHPGLAFVGFSHLRNFASATLRGAGPDARYVVSRIRRFLENSK